MRWRAFRERFRDQQLISVQDVRNVFDEVSDVQLSRWVDEGLLIRIRRGQYLIASRRDSVDRELLANEIKPSYISLEYGLNYYNLIPEVPHKITSVTTGRGETVQTPMGEYLYRHIQPALFTGYRLVRATDTGRDVRIAEPTKALFDYGYFRKIGGTDGYDALRINRAELAELFDPPAYKNRLSRVNNPALRARLENFSAFLEDEDHA